MMKMVITGLAFRRLVRGDTVTLHATLSEEPAAEYEVQVILSDIGYNVMLEAIKDAINAKDETKENTDPDSAVS